MEKFLCGCFLMLIVLGAPLGLVSLRNGSFLQKMSASEAVFRRRRSLRAFMLCMSLFMAAGVPFVGWNSLQHDQARLGAGLSQSDLPVAQNTNYVVAVVGVGIGLGLLGFCVPEELRLNLDQRTYRLTRGWPPLGLIQSGVWDDIGGIYIKNIRSACFVCLGYKYPAGRRTLIGISGRNSGAVRLARDLATRLSLPLINSPAGK